MMDTEVLRSGIGEKTWSSSSIPRLIMDEDTTNTKPTNKTITSPLKEVRAKIRQEVRRESIASIFGIHTQQRRDSGLEDKRGRRKSWHPKFERKRRKGIVAPSVSPPLGLGAAGTPFNIPEQRQKRASWWNIFVPDNWPSRSRRASQDVGRVYRSAENVVPWLRSKSRSVDHGVSTPFDIEALRSKVEGRFESVDKLSRDGSESEGSNLTEKKKPQGPPENTTTYTVADRDTLTSVAARFDTTPSELTKLNRLGTPYIFPGQQLYVPQRDSKLDEESEASTSTPVDEGHDDLPPEEKELLDNLRPVSPKPGHAERVRTPLGTSMSASSTTHTSLALGGSDMEEEAAFKERFLKINVRHITDGQGVVGGVLLVTPNAVMFDPNVSDPLVIEHGPESYGVIAPMEFVVNAAIYHDIAHMRVGHSSQHSYSHSSSDPKPEIYYVKSSSCDKCETHSPGKDSLLVKDETFPELGAGGDDAESVCSCAERDRDGDAFPKAFERDLVTPTNLSIETDAAAAAGSSGGDNEIKTAEERRKSMLDHHWAIPSKDRSLDDTPPGSATLPVAPLAAAMQLHQQQLDMTDGGDSKPSCHDSGIDIREPIPIVPPIQAKAKYSDADIVLSTDWVPPVTIVPTNVVTSQQEDTSCVGAGVGRKKTSSVSFSLDSANEGDSGNSSMSTTTTSTAAAAGAKEDPEKHETKKNKMLKRLSYPLAWMETLAGEKEEDKVSSLPHSADSHSSSVFSKVFSSSPINLVDFGTGLFLSKTPSEESGGSGGAPLTPAVAGSDSPSSLSTSTTTTSVDTTAGTGTGTTSSSMFFSNSIISSVGRSSVGTFIRQPTTSFSESSSSSKSSKPPAPKLDYRSMVSVEDMPELFVSFDKLIPRPARSCDDPPLYLRLRMGKPIGRVIPRSTPIMSYGKKKMRPEYWFSVPRNRVDELYKFLHLWVPHLYGELCADDVKSKGFELVESDTELWDDDSPGTAHGSRHPSQDGEITELTKESWELIKAPYVKIYSILKTQTMSGDSDYTTDEVLPMSEELRRALYATSSVSLDVEITPPDLVGVTEILTDEHREKLCRHLPARAEGYVWTLEFSTSQHGFSLNSMYRKMNKLESPILLVIEDTDNNVFGALTSCALKVSDHFYGTGESLLFRFTPQFQVFNWTGENLYFIKGNNESLSIGAGDGKFGLWLDGDLYQGRTESCKTYGNEPLTPSVDFVVKTLECWAFI